MSTTTKSYILLIGSGCIWWLLYFIFGKINVPMVLYKAALAYVCVYVPLCIFAIMISVNNNSEKDTPKNGKIIPCSKVYGSQNNK